MLIATNPRLFLGLPPCLVPIPSTPKCRFLVYLIFLFFSSSIASVLVFSSIKLTGRGLKKKGKLDHKEQDQ